MLMHQNIAAVVLTYSEAAAFLGIPVGTLYSCVAKRAVPHLRYGKRHVRFDAAELASWRASKRVDEGSR
jgi:excisionase family DNA binding protein